MFRAQTLLIAILFASLMIYAVIPNASTTVHVTIESPYAAGNGTTTIQCYDDVNIEITLIKSSNKTIIIIDTGGPYNETLEYNVVFCVSNVYPKLVRPEYGAVGTAAYIPITVTYTETTVTKASPTTGEIEAGTQTINLQPESPTSTIISSRDRIIVIVGVALLGGVILYILGNKLL